MASLVALHDGWSSHQSTSRTSKVHSTARDKQNRYETGVCSLQHHSTKDRRMAASKEQLMNSINSYLMLTSCQMCTDYIRCVVEIMCQGISMQGRTLPVYGTDFLKCWLKWNIENCHLLFGQWVLDKYFSNEYWKWWLMSCYSRLFPSIKPGTLQFPNTPAFQLPSFPTPLHPSFTSEMPQEKSHYLVEVAMMLMTMPHSNAVNPWISASPQVSTLFL